MVHKYRGNSRSRSREQKAEVWRPRMELGCTSTQIQRIEHVRHVRTDGKNDSLSFARPRGLGLGNCHLAASQRPLKENGPLWTIEARGLTTKADLTECLVVYGCLSLSRERHG